MLSAKCQTENYIFAFLLTVVTMSEFKWCTIEKKNVRYAKIIIYLKIIKTSIFNVSISKNLLENMYWNIM
jgi:hypothetical protein